MDEPVPVTPVVDTLLAGALEDGLASAQRSGNSRVFFQIFLL
jgi:hypothetical protein